MDRQDRARRIQQYYTEIHEEVHGPDFKAQAILARDRARREAALAEAEIGGAEQRAERDTHSELPSAAGQALMLQDREDGVGAQQGAERVTHSELPGDSRPVTPQAMRPRVLVGSEVVNEGTPDRIFHLDEALQCFDEDGVTHTEISEEESARLVRLADNLRDRAGATSPEVEFGITVEQIIPKYKIAYSAWVAEDPEKRATRPIKIFAMERLGELKADNFTSEYNLKLQVYALGRLAQMDMSGCRALCKSIWESSTRYSTPLQEAERVTHSELLRGELRSPPPHVSALFPGEHHSCGRTASGWYRNPPKTRPTS